MDKKYIAIDLKSFYASVECVDRGLDPLKAHLVVADESRTEKTICLAVTPALKAYGISGRARLFEVVEKVKEINARRGASEEPLEYIVAPPRMKKYMEVSQEIYGIYLRYVAPEDLHVYSVDEVFIDATAYLNTYGLTAREFAMKMIREVLSETGITATAGIGTNLYLCKIAMDIEAKHMPADSDGVRVAELDEMSYRQKLWDHRPLTDFWRVGRGIARKLEASGIFTMGDIAYTSVYAEDQLYRMFGVNAELLIDHAWGWEPCTIEEVKKYRPDSNSLSSGQVLQKPYDFEKGKLVVREMTDLLVLKLVDKRLAADQMELTVGYDIDNLAVSELRDKYRGSVVKDGYGRHLPKPAHGTINLKCQTSSTRLITDAVMELYDRIVDPGLLVRRMYVVANHVVPESEIRIEEEPAQMDLFTDYAALEKEKKSEEQRLFRERSMQEAVLKIKKRYGKNAILKGMNFEEGATAMERNRQVGGHKA